MHGRSNRKKTRFSLHHIHASDVPQPPESPPANRYLYRMPQTSQPFSRRCRIQTKTNQPPWEKCHPKLAVLQKINCPSKRDSLSLGGNTRQKPTLRVGTFGLTKRSFFYSGICVKSSSRQHPERAQRFKSPYCPIAVCLRKHYNVYDDSPIIIHPPKHIKQNRTITSR